VSNGTNFAKDYQKDSYNKRIFIAKKLDDKNIGLGGFVGG
jgi:hypothetical protein